jgi:hypothetical protein
VKKYGTLTPALQSSPAETIFLLTGQGIFSIPKSLTGQEKIIFSAALRSDGWLQHEDSFHKYFFVMFV